jgi:excisionase family DNA binding protein
MQTTINSPHKTPAKSPHAPLCYSVKDACHVSSIGRTRLYSLIAEGKLQARKVGKRTLIPADSLRALISGEAA